MFYKVIKYDFCVLTLLDNVILYTKIKNLFLKCITANAYFIVWSTLDSCATSFKKIIIRNSYNLFNGLV